MPSMISAVNPTPATRRNLKAIVTVVVVGVLGAFALDSSRPDVQAFTVVSVVILGGVIMWSGGAARRFPPITRPFLIGAYLLHVLGSLLKFTVIQWFYDGTSDSVTYFVSGKVLVPMFRALQLPPFPKPGTEFMSWISGLILAIAGDDSILGGFVVCSSLAFFGAWFFYKAFCTAFPEGNKQLFKLLIFLIPTMWYWPSSLGKDAIICFFLGLATYGFSLIFTTKVVQGMITVFVGLGGMLIIRPPLAAVPVIAGAFALLVQPVRYRSLRIQLVAWLVVAPLLLGMVVFAIQASEIWVGNKTFEEAYEDKVTQEYTGAGSNFTSPNLASPAGVPNALITANIRPFPWEAGGLLPALTALEGVFIVYLIATHWRAIARAFYRWKENAMMPFAAAAWIGMSLVISSLSNFGLLARQRAQALPFLLMMIAAVATTRADRSAGRGWRAADP